MWQKLSPLLLVAGLLALLLWRGGAFSSEPTLEARWVGKPAPSLQGTFLADSLPPLAYKGRVTVLNVWATWCRPCLAELPELERRYRYLRGKYGGRFQLVGITGTYQGENPQAYRGEVTQLVLDQALTYPQWLDERHATLSNLGIGTFPTSVLIDTDGRVRSIGIGPMGTARVLLEAEALLQRAAD